MRRRRLLVFVSLWCVTGCAGVLEAAGGTCLALGLRVGGQLCVDAACHALCDDDPSPDDDDDDDDDDPPDEIPPPPGAAADVDAADAADVDVDGATRPRLARASATATCRLWTEARGTQRLACVDGTRAVAIPPLAEQPPSRLSGPDDGQAFRTPEGGTIRGDVVVRTAADLADLAGVLAITGSLRIEGARLVRARLPSLRSVGRDLIIADNAHLVELELPRLVRVSGHLVLAGNDALSTDPFPRLRRAGDDGVVDVDDNAVLPNPVVDRLRSLPARSSR